MRIQGIVEEVSDTESDAYYHSRPLGSRLGVQTSEQNSEVPDRTMLGIREAEYRQRLGDAPPRPPHWDDYQLLPEWLEFWQGRSPRLHDRLEYCRHAGGSWTIIRLTPQLDGRYAIRYCAPRHASTAPATEGSVRHIPVRPAQHNGRVCHKLK